VLVVVVQVGSVRMLVLDPVVLMWMTVRLGDGPGVRVAVVLVVHVQVLVLDRFVDVEVSVLLADEQRDPGCHQRRGQARGLLGRLLQKVICQAERRLPPDSGQLRKFGGEIVDSSHARTEA